ncbi:MAG: DUF2589 domain-containing protein [Muribaculaceae bacterium]|nr:DUF2589 domain-containing protein [Muribaculaceae bacterium]
MNSLDFSVYIGGPLKAAIDAQNAASMAQVHFIKEVGFKQPVAHPVAKNSSQTNQNSSTSASTDDTESAFTAQDLVYANFEYERQNENGEIVTRRIRVPFLTMLNIPSIRIEEITIDFNAKLTAVETEDTNSTLGVGATVGAGCKFASLSVATSYQRTNSKGSKVDKTYSLTVHVSAVNDEMPAGLDRILSMLESEITAVDVKKQDGDGGDSTSGGGDSTSGGGDSTSGGGDSTSGGGDSTSGGGDSTPGGGN